MEGPPPPLPPPPPPVPVPVAFETEAVVVDVVLIVEGVAEADTKFREEAASRATVDAQKMLSTLPAGFLEEFLAPVPADADPVAVEFNINAVVG